MQTGQGLKSAGKCTTQQEKRLNSPACLFQYGFNWKYGGWEGLTLFFSLFFPTARRCEPLVSLVLHIGSSSVLSRPGGVIRLPPSRASSANHTSHGSTNRKINCRPTERLTGGRFLWYNEAGDTRIRLLNTDGISGQLILMVMQGQRSSVSLSAEPDHIRVCSIHTDTAGSRCTDC